MPRKKQKEDQHGLFRLFGFTVNFNSVLTSVFGTVACTLVTWMLISLHNFIGLAQTMIKDVPKLEKELHRLQVEYPPLPKPNFNASIAATPVPTP